MPANSLNKLVLSTDEVDDIVGLTLSDRAEFPNPALSANDYNNPSCTLATGLTKEALGNGEFTGFRQVKNQAKKDDNLIGVFVQNVAIFETAAKASELFHKAYGSLGKCNATTIAAKSDPTAWKIVATGPFNGDVATFHELQLTDNNQNMGWRCDHEARVKNNVMLEASACAWANGAPFVAAGLDQIGAGIPPASKPSPPTPPGFLAPTKINSVVLGIPQVGSIIGTSLGETNTYPYPPDPRNLGDKSNCSPLVGPDANSFGINVDYTAFREADYRENKDDYQHIVNQQVATYPDAQPHRVLFRMRSRGWGDATVRWCPREHPTSSSSYRPPPSTAIPPNGR